MTIVKKTPFHKKAKEKGWDLQDIAERWGISVRQMSRVANNPKQKDLDAVNGLPMPEKKT
jgi:predicted transcriptional regulator